MNQKVVPAKDTIREILNSASKADNLNYNFHLSITERYKNFLIKYVAENEKNKSKTAATILNAIEVILTISGSCLGVYLAFAKLGEIEQVIVWSIYAIASFLVFITIKQIPTDNNVLNSEATKINLLNLSERLATEVALFSLLDNFTDDDDNQTISKISQLVPEVDNLNDVAKQKILTSLSPSFTVTDTRDSLEISVPNLKISEEVANKLNKALEQIVELSSTIFACKDLRAKIYFKVEKKINDKEIKLLVPFARYGPWAPKYERNPNGTTWIYNRSNHIKAWDALDKGHPIDFNERRNTKLTAMGDYYDSLLAINLPGGVGVLVLTSDHKDTFENKYDSWITKALAVSTATIALKILDIS